MAVRTIKRGGERYYISPEDDTLKVPGVTSVLNMLPKDFLGPWNAKMVAQEAVTNLGPVVGLVAAGNHQAAIDMLKGAAYRDVKEASALGTDAHDLFERLAAGEEIAERRIPKALHPFRIHFLDFLEKVQPEYLFAEEMVWSGTHKYAGSFDAFTRIQGETTVTDYKTTRSGVHEQVALQNKAYASADHMILADTGETAPIPAVTASTVLHVRPEGWALYAIDFSDDLFEYFLALRKVFDWEQERKKHAIGDIAYHGGERTTGSKRRASR